MTILDQIATKIIKEQELIIGPIAWYEAGKIKGLHVIDSKVGTVSLEEANGKLIVNDLVARYTRLFGPAAQKVCKEAVTALIADLQPSDVPSSLQ